MAVFIAYVLAFLAFVGLAMLYGAIQGAQNRSYNGNEYRHECVGTNVSANYHNALEKVCGNMSLKEYKKLELENSYYAWVRVGYDRSTWKEEPVNKELYLKISKNWDKLPKYLQEPGIMTKGQYMAKYGNK